MLLFGIATSLDLFQERLPRIASRSLHGAQFDVEQTSSLVERIFKKVLAGGRAPLRLSTTLVASLMERQQEHAQSVQSFTAALKVGSRRRYGLLNRTDLPSMLICAIFLQML